VRPVTPEISSLRLQRGDEIEPVADLKEVGVDAVIVVSTDSPIDDRPRKPGSPNVPGFRTIDIVRRPGGLACAAAPTCLGRTGTTAQMARICAATQPYPLTSEPAQIGGDGRSHHHRRCDTR
jgi:hypothetical protein